MIETGTRKEAVEMVTRLLLMSTGADIKAPQEVKDAVVEAFGLQENRSFEKIDAILSIEENKEKAFDIISAIILTHLTPTEMIQVHKVCHTGIKAILNYTKVHPECKKRPEPEEAINKVLRGADFDIDKVRE